LHLQEKRQSGGLFAGVAPDAEAATARLQRQAAAAANSGGGGGGAGFLAPTRFKQVTRSAPLLCTTCGQMRFGTTCAYHS
jgi:hypothetical protein